MKLASRLLALAPSPTLAVSNRAAELKRSGVPVLSFAAGEPDFDTPAHVTAAMTEAVKRGATRYPPALGLPELRTLVASTLSNRYAVPLDAREIAITPGAKYALWAAFQALVSPGDEVLVPTPCWVSYAPQIALAEGVMVPVPCHAEDEWRLTAQAIAKAITPRTVGIALNVPNNPTGQLASAEVMNAIGDLAIAHDLWLLCDDIYAELCFGAPFTSPLTGRRDLLERTVIVDGPSKSHAMTGWRLGYLRAPTRILDPIARLIGQTATGVTTFAQYGAIAALSGSSSFVDNARTSYARRSELLVKGLQQLEIPVVAPQGAFYALADVRAWLAPKTSFENDVALASALLERQHVATVPGSAFEAPGFLRLSFATSDSVINEGLERLGQFLSSL
jgi:aspartate aminotransferase